MRNNFFYSIWFSALLISLFDTVLNNTIFVLLRGKNGLMAQTKWKRHFLVKVLTVYKLYDPSILLELKLTYYFTHQVKLASQKVPSVVIMLWYCMLQYSMWFVCTCYYAIMPSCRAIARRQDMNKMEYSIIQSIRLSRNFLLWKLLAGNLQQAFHDQKMNHVSTDSIIQYCTVHTSTVLNNSYCSLSKFCKCESYSMTHTVWV